MNKSLLMKISLVALYVGLSGWFIYQGLQAQQQIQQAEKVVVKKQEAVQQVEANIKDIQTQKTVKKTYNLVDFDKKANDIALLMYNESFTNDKELQAYKDRVSKYVTPSVLETISHERMPTVWSKDAKATQYKVENVGRMSVSKNGVQYLVTLAPKEKDDLKVILQMHYNIQSGLVDEFSSERELKTNADK
jgi:cytoskeletal protein RodZ